jgi:capsular polysaccharide biosynthesis protein
VEQPVFAENETELIDYLNVIWKRKWLIIIPTFLLVIAVGIYSFLSPKVWEIDSIIVPSKFFIQTEQGTFEEIVVIDPKQIASQINESTYNILIATELNLDIEEFPKLKAENLRDTKLVRVSLKEEDTEKAKQILYSLFNHLKKDLDKKIEVEIKDVDTQIASDENLIKQKGLNIKNNGSEIKLNQIEKNKARQKILSSENMLKISEDRVKSIMEEMKEVKKRIDELEKQQREALSEKKQGIDAISLLLYSNEVQQNLRYYNMLEEKLSNEKIVQENLNLLIKDKNEDIKKLDTQIEKLKTEIDRINNEIEEVKNNIAFSKERKARIDYTQLIKEPTSSIGPVSPKKKLNVLIAGVLGLFAFTILAFFLDYLKKQRIQSEG